MRKATAALCALEEGDPDHERGVGHAAEPGGEAQLVNEVQNLRGGGCACYELWLGERGRSAARCCSCCCCVDRACRVKKCVAHADWRRDRPDRASLRAGEQPASRRFLHAHLRCDADLRALRSSGDSSDGDGEAEPSIVRGEAWTRRRRRVSSVEQVLILLPYKTKTTTHGSG